MQNRRLVLIFLLIVPMLFGTVIKPDFYSNAFTQDNVTNDLLEPIEYQDFERENVFALSQDSRKGVINPVQIRESGFQETDVVRATTDTGTNTIQNITIDDGNNWFANYTRVEVANIKRLYGVNGTFEDGVKPWTNYTIDGGSNTQIAAYDSGGEFVICRNVGNYKWASQHTWQHSAGSEIGWEQKIYNIEGKKKFNIRLDFRYATGPIDPEGDNGFSGDIGLFYQVSHGVYLDAWYFPMEIYVDSRNAWYSLDHDFTLPSVWSDFDIAVGLWLADDVTLNNVTDYDDDPLGLPDGIVNAQNLTVYIDNVEFTGIEVPTFESVDLTFHAGSFSETITGSGVGIASITNPAYWTTNPLEVQITSNTSVVFTYSVTTFYHHLINSSWTTDLSKYGVSYSIDPGLSADMELYTYVTTSSEYENRTLEIEFPMDWENTTILDPLQNDITGLCTVTAGNIFVPSSLFTRVGWWKITYQAFNYAKNISIQMQDSSTGGWTENSLFRTGNITRAQVEIGTASVTPGVGAPVSIQWVMPNGTIWISESILSIISGHVNSSSWILGATNTSAGEWIVEMSWNNGTELAYGFTLFDLYHQASATVSYPTIEADYGQVISNLITFKDADTGKYLLDDSASIVANWSNTIATFTQNYAKNWWEADFDTMLIGNGRFVVEVNASMPYFDMVTTQFTVISFFETSLEILNAGSIPIENGLNEIFTVLLSYELLNGTGVAGALPTVTHTGPQEGLSWHSFVDNNNGFYSLDIVCNISEVYGVTITLSKPYHYNTTDSFTLIIGETGSEIELLNGTADVVLYGNSYRLVVEYRNSTGQGLPGANLQVVAVTPTTGLNYTVFMPITDGYYEIVLTPGSAGTFSIVISASILNHETQYATFTLTASGIPTILTTLPSSTTIAINQTFTLQLRFQDESFNTIDIAIITLINPPSGLTVSGVISIGNGLYNITIQALEIKTFDLLFRASAHNYQSSSAGFTLVVTEIQTALRFAEDITSTSVAFANTYQLIVYYEQTSPVAAIQDANITVLPADIIDLEIHITEYTGYYVISIRGYAIGSWILSIVANKTDHRVATKQFFIIIERIDTRVEGVSPFEALRIGRSYTFNFSYIFESNSSYIHGATILASGEGSDWVSYLELISGKYSVNLTPQELGEHYVTLTFEKTGFETRYYRLTFSVERVPITIEVLQGLSAPESSQSTILVRVTEVDTGRPVNGVQVFCNIINPIGHQSDPIAMNPTSIPGEYSAVLTMPTADGIYQLKITCEAANYVMSSAYFVQLQPGRDIITMLWVTTTQYYPFMLILAAIGVGLVYRRSARKRRIRENKAALAVKRRFDDVKSILGVIVLHKDSGLPVYSKILRDGLEETVISAFITAITSFRGEFDIEASSEEWGLIPISDIVRVISTNRLVCAFITTGNPSAEQRERMIEFAKKVGFIFDDTLSNVPIVVLDHHTKMQFDALFEDSLDGALLRTYKLDDAKKLPTNTCALERIARKQGVEFKLEELASEIASCGLEEGRVYKAIMTALEDHYLVTTDVSPFADEIIRASESVQDEI